MSDILDLDVLVPEPKKAKIAGKIVDVYPPKVLHLIEMQRVFEKFKEGNVLGADATKMIRDAILPIVPAIQEDPTIDFTMEQLLALLRFAQSIAVPDEIAKNMPEQTPKKKQGE
jgi:hypothetical protein